MSGQFGVLPCIRLLSLSGLLARSQVLAILVCGQAGSRSLATGRDLSGLVATCLDLSGLVATRLVSCGLKGSTLGPYT